MSLNLTSIRTAEIDGLGLVKDNESLGVTDCRIGLAEKSDPYVRDKS